MVDEPLIRIVRAVPGPAGFRRDARPGAARSVCVIFLTSEPIQTRTDAEVLLSQT